MVISMWYLIVGFINILNGESTSDDSTESSVETSDPSCTEANDHSNEQASSLEIEVDGLVRTETKQYSHNSKAIVDCENVENDKVEPDNHGNNPQNDHQIVLSTNSPLQRTIVSAK